MLRMFSMFAEFYLGRHEARETFEKSAPKSKCRLLNDPETEFAIFADDACT